MKEFLQLFDEILNQAANVEQSETAYRSMLLHMRNRVEDKINAAAHRQRERKQ